MQRINARQIKGGLVSNPIHNNEDLSTGFRFNIHTTLKGREYFF